MAQTKGVRLKGSENEDLTSNEINMSFAKWSLADNAEWTCKACTFLNDNPRHLKCAACGTTRETSSSAQASSSAILNEQLQDIDEEEYYENDRHGQSEQTVSNETDYEANIIEERLQEHVAMQQEMLDEIQREREENDRKMKELREYQQRILDKLEREKVERDNTSTSSCPTEQEHQDTKKAQDEPTIISISQSNNEEKVVEDYRRHLMEQRLALEESSRHIQSMSGLVKMEGSGKSGSLSRGLQKKADESQKGDKMTSLQRMKKEWIQRERKLRTLRNQMRTKLKNEEDKLKNTAA